jgi:hypothetical protein
MTYPTWHPAVDPASGCVFGHEHGDDPTASGANSELPAFGYVPAQMVGMDEAHAGYKVFNLTAGEVSEDGRVVRADYRIVFHFGTSGTRRYTEDFHSMMYDYVARDGSGRFAHVMGMADTALAALDGSTCDVPRRGGRDFSTIGCDDTYEIWGFAFSIVHPDDPFLDPTHVRLYLSGSVATFDPVLTRDPADNEAVVYTQTYRGDPFDFRRGDGTQIDPLSKDAYYQGCQREAYGGPNYWLNARNPSEYYTDVFGNVQPGPGMGTILQQVSAQNSGSNELYKVRNDHCVYGLLPPN